MSSYADKLKKFRRNPEDNPEQVNLGTTNIPQNVGMRFNEDERMDQDDKYYPNIEHKEAMDATDKVGQDLAKKIYLNRLKKMRK